METVTPPQETHDIEAFDKLLGASPIGIQILNKEGTILWANSAILNILGYEADEYIGQPMERFYKYETMVAGILVQLIHGESVKDFKTQFKAKDGSRKDILLNANGIWENEEFAYAQLHIEAIPELQSHLSC